MVAVMMALYNGQPRRSLSIGPPKDINQGYFSVNSLKMRELRRVCKGPFAAALVGVLGHVIFKHLSDSGAKVPDELHVGVLVGFEVKDSEHFNKYGVIPITIKRPSSSSRPEEELCKMAGKQLLQRAVMAEAAWVLTNVYNKRSVGVIDVYASLDFVVSCAPLTGGSHEAPLKLIGTDVTCKSLSSDIFVTMPLYCIAQSYDSKVDLTFVSRTPDVPIRDLKKYMTNWSQQ